MKKLLAFLLAVFLLISLVACGPDDSGDPEDPKDDPNGDSQGGTPDASPDEPDNDPAVPDLDWGYPL